MASAISVAIRIIGSIARIAIRIVGSIARRAQLVVDGNHVLHEKKYQHIAFEDQTYDDGAEKHDQNTVTAHPMRVIRVEQQKEADHDHENGMEYVQTLADFFGDERPEVENIMQNSPSAIQLRTLFLGDDEDEDSDDCYKGQHTGDHCKYIL